MTPPTRRLPTELVLALAGLGLGVVGFLGNGADAAALAWTLGGALVVSAIYLGVSAVFVGPLSVVPERPS